MERITDYSRRILTSVRTRYNEHLTYVCIELTLVLETPHKEMFRPGVNTYWNADDFNKQQGLVKCVLCVMHVVIEISLQKR